MSHSRLCHMIISTKQTHSTGVMSMYAYASEAHRKSVCVNMCVPVLPHLTKVRICANIYANTIVLEYPQHTYCHDIQTLHGCLNKHRRLAKQYHHSTLETSHTRLYIKLKNGRSTPGCLTVQSAIWLSLLRRLSAHWWNKYASCM